MSTARMSMMMRNQCDLQPRLYEIGANLHRLVPISMFGPFNVFICRRLNHRLSLDDLDNLGVGALSHDVRLTGRRELEITGVTRVETFDVNAFELATSEGGLYIEGDALHMKRFDVEAGIVRIEGKITSLAYADDGKRRNPFGRLWK